MLIVKWGGSLTQEGRDQSTNLGKHFRETYYPGEGLGFLRLHSTFRHDLKIYSSEEGRVQMTAAAFVKGFLDLEGKHLTPILVSLVTSSPESTLVRFMFSPLLYSLTPSIHSLELIFFIFT